MSFVGYTKQPVSDAELQKLLEQFAQETSYYFLRWAHTVSGVWQYSPSNFPHPESLKSPSSSSEGKNQFPSPEGQLFNAELELRWKRQGSGYSVLLLSENLDAAEGFTAIPGDWETCDRHAEFYGIKDTRFPKGFTYPEKFPIQQRYFSNAKTATVHFVALTVTK